MEEYRSGHNEAVLKTVWGQPHAGSNPVSSAKAEKSRIKCGIFYALAEETELKRSLVVRVSAEPTYAEGLPLCGKRRYPVSVVKKAKRIPPPHKMRDFLCFGGGDRAEGVPCGSRVGGKPTYAEGLPLCGKRRYPVSVVKKAKRISSPHTMRDFLCFGGGDRDEEVPCGSRA